MPNPPPRKPSVARRFLARLPQIILMFLALCMLPFLAYAVQKNHTNTAMLNDGLQTEGTVLRVEDYRSSSTGPDPLYVSVRYTLNGTSYTSRFRTSAEAFALATPGNPIQLYYSQDDPFTVAVVYDGIQKELRDEFIARIIIGGAIFFALLGAGALFAPQRNTIPA